MRNSKRVTVAVLMATAMLQCATAQVFEQSLGCGAGLPPNTPPPASTFNPYSQKVIVADDGVSRVVAFEVLWYAGTGILSTGIYGMEFKTYHYNYDDAQSTGKGPAYVTGPGGFSFCSLPGCYIDSDILSNRNSAGEYKEPQVAFGMEPSAAQNLVLNTVYMAFTRAVAGRGNRSLLKVRNHATVNLSSPPLPPYSVFLCRNIPENNVVKFSDGVYSPACILKTAGSALVHC